MLEMWLGLHQELTSLNMPRPGTAKDRTQCRNLWQPDNTVKQVMQETQAANSECSAQQHSTLVLCGT